MLTDFRIETIFARTGFIKIAAGGIKVGGRATEITDRTFETGLPDNRFSLRKIDPFVRLTTCSH